VIPAQEYTALPFLPKRTNAANPVPAAADAMKEMFRKYRKPVVITVSVTVLQVIFGFDPKFCIINIIWLMV
jgi:hypothetical protein